MPTANLQNAAKVTPMASHLSHPPLRAKPALIGVTALTVRAIMRQTINDAHSGATNSIVIRLMLNMKRYALTDAKVLIDLISHLLMSSTNYENGADNRLKVALVACAKNSAPGPNHIMWSHLKLFLVDVETRKGGQPRQCLLRAWTLATFFKESLSVIIPKPGKLLYSAPKAFRPIMLLNTMGKLIEKCVSNCILFDCVKHGVFQLN
jgi:hypothetical protein